MIIKPTDRKIPHMIHSYINKDTKDTISFEHGFLTRVTKFNLYSIYRDTFISNLDDFDFITIVFKINNPNIKIKVYSKNNKLFLLDKYFKIVSHIERSGRYNININNIKSLKISVEGEVDEPIEVALELIKDMED